MSAVEQSLAALQSQSGMVSVECRYKPCDEALYDAEVARVTQAIEQAVAP